MGNDQRSNSRTILDQLFWAGIEPPAKRFVQPSAEDAPNECATALVPQASPRPAEPDQVLDTHGDIPPQDTAGEEASQVDVSGAADRYEPTADCNEPKADSSEPESSQEIPTVSSPPVQPIPIEDADVADHAYQLNPEEAALADAWTRCVATATRSSSTAR